MAALLHDPTLCDEPELLDSVAAAAIALEHGLAPALDSLATRSTVPTTVTFETLERLPERVEFAAYFVASEALANIAKYAQATTVAMRAAAPPPANSAPEFP